jgi:hypothetical protein
MPAVGKKLHHFVPRFYLQAWAKNRQIHCLQEGEVFRANLKNVATENHFYRLRALSNDDITFNRKRRSPIGKAGRITAKQEVTLGKEH